MNSLEEYESDAAPKASRNQKSGPDFVRLKTNQKKMLRRALQEGLTRERALELALAIPVARSLLPAPYGIQTKSPYPYSTFLKCVKVGLSPAIPGNPLTTEQMSRIKEAIIDVTVEQSGSQKPQFEGCFCRRGWLLIICSDINTSEWLNRNLCHIQSKVDVKLKLLKESELPRKNVVRGYFPDSLTTSNKKVLDIIEAQNSVSTAEWRVMNRLTQGDLLHLVMAVDNESHRKLVKIGGNISYRFGHVKLYMDRKSVLNGREKKSNMEPLEKKSQGKSASSQTNVPLLQEPAMRNDGPWNFCDTPRNTYNNSWNQQPNFTSIPINPSEYLPYFRSPEFSGWGFWNGGFSRDQCQPE
ncbi:uncharacterized protein [Drosophila takahashii]|uniref:uncharacterized protein n=1 Tax=Drosophila takahashii TaxID=29030 RepID=UPI001CF898AB|nr:uncharacterized protein LOC108065384 [Drosophila takahashii]